MKSPQAHGTKTPCRANTVLFPVDARPSGPPSNTSIWPSSQIARFPSLTVPGNTASAVVVMAQVAPTVVSAVPAQGTVTGKVKSLTVAGSSPVVPLCLSVIRRVGLGPELAAVVVEVGLAADVGEAHGDLHVGLVLWGARVAGDDAEAHAADRLRRLPLLSGVPTVRDCDSSVRRIAGRE